MAKINLGPNSSSINFYGNGGGGGEGYPLETFILQTYSGVLCRVSFGDIDYTQEQNWGRLFTIKSSKYGNKLLLACVVTKQIFHDKPEARVTLFTDFGTAGCYLCKTETDGTYDFMVGDDFVNPMSVSALSVPENPDGSELLSYGLGNYTWIHLQDLINNNPNTIHVGTVSVINLSYLSGTLLQVMSQLKAGLSQTNEMSIIINNVGNVTGEVIGAFLTEIEKANYPTLKIGNYMAFVSDYFDDGTSKIVSYSIKELDNSILYHFDFTFDLSSMVVTGKKITPTVMSM